LILHADFEFLTRVDKIYILYAIVFSYLDNAGIVLSGNCPQRISGFYCVSGKHFLLSDDKKLKIKILYFY